MDLNPSEIMVKNGTGMDSFGQAELRNRSIGAYRGIRGLEVNASKLSPKTVQYPDLDLNNPKSSMNVGRDEASSPIVY